MRHGVAIRHNYDMEQLPLAAALGSRFKVYLPYRARKTRVYCRRCMAGWWLPREAARSTGDAAWLSRHRCAGARRAS